MAIDLLTELAAVTSKTLLQIITGKLFTEDQIRNISQNTIGAYFKDFFPPIKEEAEAKKRVEQAQAHINEASRIISDLQGELQNQAGQLDQIVREIEEKKKIADHYATLAETNQKAFEAFKEELEETLRKELRAESERGKRARQVVSLAFWIITLVLGAALGAYFIPLVTFLRGLIKI
jgi:predicted RNase H-like nuclease (RuvC/YqgF family)